MITFIFYIKVSINSFFLYVRFLLKEKFKKHKFNLMHLNKILMTNDHLIRINMCSLRDVSLLSFIYYKKKKIFVICNCSICHLFLYVNKLFLHDNLDIYFL